MPRKPLTPEQEKLMRRKSRAKPKGTGGVVAGTPQMPKTLSAVAQEKWKQMITILRQRGILTKGDGPALEIYCESYARWRKCLAEIEDDGVMVTVDVMDSSGVAHTKKVLNPACRMASTLENSQRAMLQQLCTTVASRNSVTPAPPKTKPLAPDSAGAMFPESSQDQTGVDDDPMDF